MKKALLITLALSYVTCTQAQDFGSFASAVFIRQSGKETGYNITGSGADLINPDDSTYSGDLGSFVQNSGTLILSGGEVKTYKDNGTNVCGATMFYSIHLSNQIATNFTSLDLPYKAGCDGGTFTDGLGPCNGNDQKWNNENAALNLTKYLPGTYAIDVYYKIRGSNSSTNGCDDTDSIGSNVSVAGTMTFTITNNPLPLTAITFTGKNTEGANALQWDIISDITFQHFDLEKSNDGISFHTIANVQAQATGNAHYTFIDKQPYDKQNIYRLKAIADNGSFGYSNIVFIDGGARNHSVLMLPNPATGYVTVKAPLAETATITISDATGKMIRNVVTHSLDSKLDLSGIAKGIYIIRYQSEHTSQSVKIEKQ